MKVKPDVSTLATVKSNSMNLRHFEWKPVTNFHETCQLDKEVPWGGKSKIRDTSTLRHNTATGFQKDANLPRFCGHLQIYLKIDFQWKVFD